jgi:hypothetical protein
MRAAGIASVVLGLGAIMSGCTDGPEQVTEPTSAVTTPAPTTSPSAERSRLANPLGTTDLAGPGGMTIRYLDSDGKIKTIRVEDLPH